MKPILTLLLFFLLSVMRLSAFTFENIRYSLDGSNAVVVGIEGVATDVIIPESVPYKGNEYPVTQIGNNSYVHVFSSSFLTSIKIPPTVSKIYGGAFVNCTNLREVTFEGNSGRILIIDNRTRERGNTRADEGAFENCPNLSNLIVGRIIERAYTEETNHYIEEAWGIFADCPIKDITFSSECSVITEKEFADVKSLEHLTIPSLIQTIMPNAFENCVNLKNVSFEESSDPLFLIGDFGQSGIEVLNLNRQLYEGTVQVGSVGTFTCMPSFAGCTGLTSINFGKNFTSICENMFSGCSALRSVTIPSNISKIGEGAFSGCTNLKSINIEDSDEPILINSKTNMNGESTTFAGAPLETLYLGRNVEYNGTELSPFKNKNLLTTLTIGNKTTAINNYLFYGCSNIAMLSVPSSVKIIGDYAFYDCNQSRILTISKSVERIGEYAFYNCKNLKSLTIPGSVVTIGDYAFRSCSNLTNIKIGEKVETIGNYAFLDCFSAENITLGNSVKNIGNNAFYNCQAWTNIVIPYSVKSIGSDAFALCLGAKEITIGDGVENIGVRAFTDCENLSKLTIGSSVKEIGDMAFFNCENLKDVYVAALVPPVANESVFSDYSAMLHVPNGKKGIYKDDIENCWPLFANIGEYTPESGIDDIITDTNNTAAITEVYNLKGIKINSDVNNLPSGIYIVRQGNTVQKISVK